MQHDTVTAFLATMPDWDVSLSDSYECAMTQCSIEYYDVLVLDATLNSSRCIETIREIRGRQIFTPILVIADIDDKEMQLVSLTAGADMCITKPFDTQEMILRIRVLKRRNTNYQSPTISFDGIDLNRPDGKICFGLTSLSVNPIEIEVFRLLTRASAPIHVKTLAEKMNEPEDKVIFSAKCLQKKIGLLGCETKLEIRGPKCMLRKKVS